MKVERDPNDSSREREEKRGTYVEREVRLVRTEGLVSRKLDG